MRAVEIFEGKREKLSAAQMEFLIHQMQIKQPEDFNYEVIFLDGKYLIVETTTNIVVYETNDEAEADEYCDHFNHDKFVGKDALVFSLKKNKEKYSF